MTKFRKKPVTIEANQITHYEDIARVSVWLDAHGVRNTINLVDQTLIIPTLEGDMTAQIGDYVIRGVQGEFYPCKPDIFEATYELAEEDDD